MSIGQRIKQQREAIGMSQEELAQKLGYKSRSTINKIESGINDITQSKVIEFAQALDTTPAYLMGWEDETDTKKVPVQAEETGNNISFEEFERMVNDVKTGRGNEKAVIAGFGKDGNDIIHISQEEFDVAWAAIEALRKSRKKKHEK